MIGAALSLGSLPGTAGAADSATAARDVPGAFDVHIAREDLAIDYRDDSSGGDLELTRLGFAFHEELGAGVRGGVSIGALGIRQRDREATAEVDPTGWYLALDFDGIWPREAPLGLNAGLSWRYSRADRSDEDGNETILDWNAGEFRLALVARLARSVDVRAGMAATAVRGDERFLAEESSTTRFDIEDSTSGYVQLDFHALRTGVIRFRIRGGNPRGAWIGFEHQY